MRIDAHCHTNCSDGVVTIEQRMDMIRSCGYKAGTITDHDFISSRQVELARSCAPDIAFVPGIEITATHLDKTVHVLGYFLDPDAPSIVEHIRSLDEREGSIVDRMLSVLRSRYGVEIEKGELDIDSLHCARYLRLIKVLNMHIGYDSSRLFEYYYGALGALGLVWNDFFDCTVKNAIDKIHQAGGIAVVAHPGHGADPSMEVQGFLDHSESIIKDYADMGIDGIETHCPSHSEDQNKYFKDWADKYGLLSTEGSDCHGSDRSLGPSLMDKFHPRNPNGFEDMVARYEKVYGRRPSGIK